MEFFVVEVIRDMVAGPDTYTLYDEQDLEWLCPRIVRS
jgi:hypothetical protein